MNHSNSAVPAGCIPRIDLQRPPPARSTPREQLLLEGIEALSDVDLVALVLGTGTRDEPAGSVASRLVHDVGGVRALHKAGVRELARHHGIGTAKATRLLAACELGRRAGIPRAADLHCAISCAEDVQRWASPALAALSHEEVWLLSLNAKHQVLARRCIGVGGVHGCALTPKDVLRPAIKDCATAIVLVHNHPSGDPTPSGSDIEMTLVLAQAARTVGLQLLDHIVVSTGGYRSLLEMGTLEAL